MTKGEELRRNTNNCVYLADQARDEVSQRRYRRMEEAWLVLAELQDWLDSENPPCKADGSQPVNAPASDAAAEANQ